MFAEVRRTGTWDEKEWRSDPSGSQQRGPGTRVTPSGPPVGGKQDGEQTPPDGSCVERVGRERAAPEAHGVRAAHRFRGRPESAVLPPGSARPRVPSEMSLHPTASSSRDLATCQVRPGFSDLRLCATQGRGRGGGKRGARSSESGRDLVPPSKQRSFKGRKCPPVVKSVWKMVTYWLNDDTPTTEVREP